MAEKYKHYTLNLELLDGKKFQIPLAIPCGEKGERGAQGPKGDRGEKGERGEKGDPGGGGGVSFKTDKTLKLENGILSVNTADKAEEDNTLPITSAAVHEQLGNIEVLLQTI